jgi:hypothetical protein
MTDVTPLEPAPKKHRWDHDNEKRLAAAATASGCGETHRACKDCKLIKITVHPAHGRPWPEFILPGATARIQLDHTPECQPSSAAAVEDIR